MTEDEVRLKRCCGPVGCGFTDPRQDDCRNGERWCIGSECMAWQWDAWRCGEGCGIGRTGEVDDDKHEPCKPPKDSLLRFYDHIGHCGLISAPVQLDQEIK